MECAMMQHQHTKHDFIPAPQSQMYSHLFDVASGIVSPYRGPQELCYKSSVLQDWSGVSSTEPTAYHPPSAAADSSTVA